MSIEQDVMKSMVTSLDHLKTELKGLRSGRANPALLDSVHVEVYGTSMRLKDIATVTVPESRQLLVAPFDPNNLSAIAKAIEAANLNLNPRMEGGAVRIQIPPMDEAIRKDIVKQCKKKGEDAKVVIREIRRKFNDMARKQKSEAKITEDELKRLEKVIQDKTDKFCKDIDTACAAKEKEILEI